MSNHCVNPFYRTTTGDAFGYDPTRGVNNSAFKYAYRHTSEHTDPARDSKEFIRTVEQISRSTMLRNASSLENSGSASQSGQFSQSFQSQEQSTGNSSDEGKSAPGANGTGAGASQGLLSFGALGAKVPKQPTAKEICPYKPQEAFAFPTGADKLPLRVPSDQLDRHVPTYGGFVPGAHDQIGVSFSKASALSRTGSPDIRR